MRTIKFFTFLLHSLITVMWMIPSDLKYTKTHEWAKIEGNKAKIGITDYAQEQLHDIVYVELPEIGTHVERDQEFGVVESVKTASDVYSPLSGKVIGTNNDVVNTPELLNEDPYKNYLIEIEIEKPEEIEELLSAEEYEKFVEEEKRKES